MEGLNQEMSAKQDKSLQNAIKEGNLHKVRDILQKDSDISNRLDQRFSPYGNTPCHEAAFRGHVDILKLLLEHGVNVNVVGKKGNTPLHDAASEGHVDILQLLLNHGANVNSVNNDFDTPLHDAAREGHVDILQLLLNHSANASSVNKDHDTPLHDAARKGHVDILQLLLDYNANVSSVNKDHDTPLHDAAINGPVESIQLLLNHGANVNSVGNAGNTPLHDAALNGHFDIIQLLLDHGANGNSVNKDQDTPLHSAASVGHADILQLLLNHDANVNVVDRWTDTPLHRAASFGRVKCIKLLLKSGADIKARNGKGETPYQIAVRRKDEKSAQCFRNAGDEEDEELMNSSQDNEEDEELMNSSQEDEEEEYSRAYSKAFQEGEAKNNRIPIMLIGQDRGGKTSLMKRLSGLPFNKDEISTIGIDVDVIELTEENAENSWRKREVKEFMTNEGEAETMIYKKTAEYVDKGVQRISERDMPEPLQPKTPVMPVELLPIKPLLRQEISKIKSQRSNQHNQKEVLRVFLNDFAGQSVYYDTHGCFVKPHCPYVLVHDLSLEFDKRADPRFRASENEEEEEMNNPNSTINSDHFESWLKFLQGLGECEDQHYPDKSGAFFIGEGEEFELPPVLIALTHSDKVEANDSKIGYVRKRIGEILSAGKYKNVDPTPFLINNTLKDDNGDDVRKLRRKLFDLAKAVLKQEKSMPIRWVNFEAALSKKLSPNCKYITVKEAKKEAEDCGIQEFEHAIKFLHRLGAVVYHSGSNQVVLDPHWLMNRFTEVITMPGKLHARSRHALEVFKEKGILFQDYLKKLKDAELLEELMQKFNLISPGEYEGKPAFYVPSVAPSMTSGEELEPSTIPSLFVTFPRQLVPMSLFTQLQVKLISEWKKRFRNQQVTPSFYCNYSMLTLIIGGDVYGVRLIDLHEFVKVTVFPNHEGDHFKFTRHFLAILKKCLDDLKSRDQLLFSMTSYEIEVQCTCCFGKKKKKCSRHHKIQCHSDRCGHCHFWKLSDLQKYYDDQSPAVCQEQRLIPEPKVFDIKSVQVWLNTAKVDGRSQYELSNEDLAEASTSGFKLGKRKRSMKAVVDGSSQCGLSNENFAEASTSDTTGSQESQEKRNKSSLAVDMCKTCESEGKKQLPSDRNKWPIYKIESSCYHEICELLDLAAKSKKPLMIALGGFSQTEVEHTEAEYKERGGVGIAKYVLGKWGSSNKENNVGALKKILEDIMQRVDVLDVIEKWQKWSLCHGCGIKWNSQ